MRHAYGRQRSDGSIIFGGARIPVAPSLPGESPADTPEGREEGVVRSVREHAAEMLPVHNFRIPAAALMLIP